MVKLRNILIAVSLLVCQAQAQSKVTISDTLFNADGSRAKGSIAISWPAFTSADGFTIAKGTLSVNLVSGTVNFALVPTAGATPAGTSYTAVYSLANSVNYTEYWTIPSTGPVTIAQIRTTPIPVPTTTFGEQQLTLGTGMAATLGFWRRSSGPVATAEGQCYWDTIIHSLKCSDSTLVFNGLGGGGTWGGITGTLANQTDLNTALNGKISSLARTGLTQVAPPASSPTVALANAGAGNVDNGGHNYAVTFVTATGETTIDSTNTCETQVTVANNAVNGKVLLTSIPTGPAGVIARKIYRGKMENFVDNYTVCGVQQLVGTIADNTTTTYTDNAPDSALGNFVGQNTTGPSIWVDGKHALSFSTALNPPTNNLDIFWSDPQLTTHLINFMDSATGLTTGTIGPMSPGGLGILSASLDTSTFGSTVFSAIIYGPHVIPYYKPAYYFNTYYTGSDNFANKFGSTLLGVTVDGAPANGDAPWGFAIYNAENGSTFGGGYSYAGTFLGTGTKGAPTDAMVQFNGTLFPVRSILTVQGAVSQSGPLQRWQNSSGTVLSSISAAGAFLGNASTATALAADGSDCSPDSYARGIDASGNATGCTVVSGGGGANITLSNLTAVNINTSLLAQSGVDLGSPSQAFRDLYLSGRIRSGPGNFLTFTPQDYPANPRFYITEGAFDNSGDPSRKDDAVSYGWNCAAGGRVDASKGAFCMVFETWYSPGPNPQAENYFEYFSPVASSLNAVRPFNIVIQANKDLATAGDFVDVDVHADAFVLKSRDGHGPVFIVTPDAYDAVTGALSMNGPASFSGLGTFQGVNVGGKLAVSQGTSSYPAIHFTTGGVPPTSPAPGDFYVDSGSNIIFYTGGPTQHQIAFLDSNITGSAASISGNLTGPVTSVGMATAFASTTGTGAVVLANSPVLPSGLTVGAAGQTLYLLDWGTSINPFDQVLRVRQNGVTISQWDATGIFAMNSRLGAATANTSSNPIALRFYDAAASSRFLYTRAEAAGTNLGKLASYYNTNLNDADTLFFDVSMTGKMRFGPLDTKLATLDASGLSAARTYTLPDTAGTFALTDANGVLTVSTYKTSLNCIDAGGTCSAAPSGVVTIPAGSTTRTVSTTAVTANSRFSVHDDTTQGGALGVTCNTSIVRVYGITAITPGVSFQITSSAAPGTNPACVSFSFEN